MTDVRGGALAERAWIVGRTSTAVAEQAAGDVWAWPEVVALVRRQMRSLLGADRDLDDVAQIALERIVRGAARFEGRSQFSTYAYRVCVRVALNHWRGRRRWRRWFSFGTEEHAEPVDDDADPGRHAWRRERARRLHAVLDRMEPMRRVVLTLADLEELPSAQIAEILGCPEPTVKSRLRLAREELAMLLARDPYFREELRGGSTP